MSAVSSRSAAPDASASEAKLRELLANVAASCTDAGVRFVPELEVSRSGRTHAIATLKYIPF